MAEQTESTSHFMRDDNKLLVLLASGTTLRQAALECGLDQSTVYRRMQNPAFRTRVEEARRAYVTSAIDRMAASQLEAIDKLRELLRDGEERTQLDAAKSLLTIGIEWRKTVVLEQRLQRLETQQSDMGHAEVPDRPLGASIAVQAESGSDPA